MTFFPDFSHLLTQYLAQSDRSSSWLARRLEVHPSTVNRWLNQATRPATPEVVVRVADLLGVHTAAERQALLVAAGFAYVEGAAIAVEAATVEPLRLQPRAKLPMASTSFVGRERELAQIAERLADPAARLVTIVGLGGMGKSRLAIEAAARMLDPFNADVFEDGLWFVGLAAVTSAGLIPAAIAVAMDLPIQDVVDLEAYVIRYLSDKRLLLILDNLEHLPDGATFIERLLEGAPSVKVLATSRQRLKLNQEWLLPLDGLTVQPSTDSTNIYELTKSDVAEYTASENSAAELFVQRAKRLQPDFTPSIQASTEVIRICRIVGGMPLAIELAAGWLRYVSLAEIANEIQANLDFLVTTTRNDAERHRSMRAVFDHSWRLLDESERCALMYASVFGRGFTRQAAAEVAGADLRLLSGLVDSSWLQRNPQGRYEIHELARQYAEEKLAAEAVMASHARAAHCAYYATLVNGIAGNEGAFSGHIPLNILLLELDNVWIGWRWAVANQYFDEIGKYVTTLAWLGDAQGLYDEVVAEFEKACALARALLIDDAVPAAHHAQITLQLARLLSNLCHLYGRAISVERGMTRGAESVELLRQLGLDGRNPDGQKGAVSPTYLEALVKMSLVVGCFHADYEQARLYADEIIRLTRGIHQHAGFYSDAVSMLGQVAFLQGKFTEAESYLSQCLAGSLSDSMRSAATDRLALIYADMGNLAQARRAAKVAVMTSASSGNRPMLGSALLTEVEVAMIQGDFEEAEQGLGRVAVIAEETNNRYLRVRFLNGQARVARCTGRSTEAQQLYQQAYELARSMARNKEAAFAQIGVGFALLDQEEFEDAARCFRAGLQAAWQRRIMPEVIWAVVGLAALKGYEHQPQIAERWLWRAETHPSCPQRVRVEAAEIRRRLMLADSAYALGEEPVQDPDTTLEWIVLELLQ